MAGLTSIDFLWRRSHRCQMLHLAAGVDPRWIRLHLPSFKAVAAPPAPPLRHLQSNQGPLPPAFSPPSLQSPPPPPAAATDRRGFSLNQQFPRID